jgi:hypothetical protein
VQNWPMSHFWNIVHLLLLLGSRGSPVGVVCGYGLDDRAIEVRFSAVARDFSSVSRPALGSIQSPVQWVQAVFSRGVGG